MSILADQLGQLARRIKLPWKQDLESRSGHFSVDAEHGLLGATAIDGQVLLTILVQARPGDSIDAICDRAREAVLYLLAAMPPRTLAQAVAGELASEGTCPHPSHRDPRAGKAGACPACGGAAGVQP